MIAAVNAILDQLPRTRVGRLGREAPAFRTCGITGFYLALIALFGGGLLTGRSLTVLAALAATNGLSFFAYTYLRMWITGREKLVLLEHVWFALAACSLVLRLMGEPVLPYLDVVSVALCPFLAMGRVGCTLVGCCHGRPALVGIVYGDASAQGGFSTHLVGVRLFPVQPIEAVGLLGIGAAGVMALPAAPAGFVFAWYLIAYAVMRFGLEGLRGDVRPHLLGLSQARWMALIEIAFALRLGSGDGAVALPVYAAPAAILVLALAMRARSEPRRFLLAPSHLREVRESINRASKDDSASGPMISPHLTAQLVSIVISPAEAGAHVSLSLPGGRNDLPLLCEISAATLPELRSEAARYSASGVLHLRVPVPLSALPVDGTLNPELANKLYGNVVRRSQGEADARAPVVTSSVTESPNMAPDATPSILPESRANGGTHPLRYFTGARKAGVS